MTYCVWDDENWSTLIHTIHQDKCILMLGPESSLEPWEGQYLPCTEILARKLVEKIEDKIASWDINLDISNLAHVAEYYCMEKDRNVLEAAVSSFYAERRNQTSELHKNLSTLPFSFVVTSTPDNMFYNALKAQGKKPIVERYHFCGDNLDMTANGSVEEPLIFHLYGTIDEPDSLALTEDDILDFLVAVLLKKPPVPSNIISALRAKNKSMLFLGFGFKYWYLRALLHILKIRSKGNRSFALERAVPSNIDEFNRTIIFFKESDYRIQFFKDDLPSFVSELKEKYENSLTCLPKGVSKALADDAPKVFICHANEDKNKAAEIYERLETEGFRAWLDQKELRGGDAWDRHINRTIKNIDYFLVLQSRALEDKLEGYVNKEIRIAMDRQRYFRPGIRFIIPLKIEACKLLEDLDYLQTIDLSEEDNFSEITKAIKRDWQRRNRGKR